MGQQIGRSVFGSQNNSRVRRDSIVATVFNKLQLSAQDIELLHRVFKDINIKGSGLILRAEFYAYFKINPNSLYDKIFSLFDFDRSGYLSFMEFVCAMWNFCSMTPDNLASFAFYLFDDDQSGSLDLVEITRLICIIHRKSATANPEIRVLINKIKNRYPEMHELDFMSCCRELPAIIAPLLAVQFSMRQQLLGENFWKKITVARLQNPIQVTHDFIAAIERDTLERIRLRKEKEVLAMEEAAKELQRLRLLNREAAIKDRERERCDHMLQYFGMHWKPKETRSKFTIVPCLAYDTYDDHVDVMRPRGNHFTVKKKPKSGGHKSPRFYTSPIA